MTATNLHTERSGPEVTASATKLWYCTAIVTGCGPGQFAGTQLAEASTAHLSLALKTSLYALYTGWPKNTGTILCMP